MINLLLKQQRMERKEQQKIYDYTKQLPKRAKIIGFPFIFVG